MNLTIGARTMLAVLGTLAVTQVSAHDESEAQAASTPAHVVLGAKELQWTDAPPALPRGAKLAVLQGDPSASGEVVTVRLKMPKGYKIPPHFHPTDEAVTVISGSFSMGMGDKLDHSAAKVLGPGGWGLMPRGKHHYAIANAETVVQVQLIGPFGITYVNPGDDPQARATR